MLNVSRLDLIGEILSAGRKPMGNFYVNYTVRGASQKDVIAAFAGRNAVVTREDNGCVVAFDEESDSQDMAVMTSVGAALSVATRSVVLAVLNHDDDILAYKLWDKGVQIDEYDSCPNYFSGDEDDSGPAGGDAQKLCKAFGASDAAAVNEILRASFSDPEPKYVFAVMRHEALVNALGLSLFAIGNSYGSFDGGALGEGLKEKDITRVHA